MSIVARLAHDRLRPEAELAELVERATLDGAVVSFTGVARPKSKGGQALSRLVLEHHPALTLRSLEQIGADAAARFEVSHIHVVHRCGEIAPGEPIVFAGASALHRRAAFDAAAYLMDRLKTDALFWKREVSGDRSEWIEPTALDFTERERWG